MPEQIPSPEDQMMQWITSKWITKPIYVAADRWKESQPIKQTGKLYVRSFLAPHPGCYKQTKPCLQLPAFLNTKLNI